MKRQIFISRFSVTADLGLAVVFNKPCQSRQHRLEPDLSMHRVARYQLTTSADGSLEDLLSHEHELALPFPEGTRAPPSPQM